MGRKNLVRDNFHPYHVWARTNNREWYFLPQDQVWNIFFRYSKEITEDYGAKIHALVLMSNHFHFLLTTPLGNLGELMNQFLREISKSVNRTIGRSNHVFGGPYKWSLIRGSVSYQHCLKYVYRNPVKAGLASSVEEYRFSSLQYVLGLRDSYFPLAPSMFDDDGVLALPQADQLAWFNFKHTQQEDDCIRRGLRHRQFKIVADPKTRKIPAIFQPPPT